MIVKGQDWSSEIVPSEIFLSKIFSSESKQKTKQKKLVCFDNIIFFITSFYKSCPKL